MEVHAAYCSNNNEQRPAKREEPLIKHKGDLLSYLFSIFVTVNFSFLESFLSSVNIDVTRK